MALDTFAAHGHRGRALVAVLATSMAVLAAQTVFAPSARAGVQLLGAVDTSGAGAIGEPLGLTANALNDVFVTDTAHQRIAEYQDTGKQVATFVRGFGAGSSATAGTDGHLYYPTDIAWFDGDVFVADTGGSEVQEFTDTGQFIRRWGNPGGKFPGDGQFAYPQGIAVDCEGHVYVTDGRKPDVQEFNKDGTFVKRFGMANVQVPVGIAVASNTATGCEDTDIYVADEHAGRIVHFSPSGTFVGYIGQPGTAAGDFSGPDQISIQRNPTTDALELWVAESGDNRIQQMVSSDQGATWQSKTMILHGDKEINQPHGVSVDRKGQIWVSNTGESQVYWYKQAAPKLTLTDFGITRDFIKKHRVVGVAADYNLEDQTCQLAVKLKVTVPPNAQHVFSFSKTVTVPANGTGGVKWNVSAQELGWMEKAWHEGHSVAAAYTAVGTCSDGAHVRATLNKKY